MTQDKLAAKVARVVNRSETCSGCGACALISARVSIATDDRGNLRPTVAAAPTPADPEEELRIFDRVCPGVRARSSQNAGQNWHPVFGYYVSAWEASAADPEIRFAGGSAGVLTAMGEWLRESAISSGTVGVTALKTDPRCTIPVVISTREEALAAAGSRYAPVSTLAAYDLSERKALVGRPCEACALARLFDEAKVPRASRPPVLSFFCAGTPSQHATDDLVRELGLDPQHLVSLRYRGNGWPGSFTAIDNEGRRVDEPYESAWGAHLGRDLPWRCKLCPDGTGGDADIAVGDYWAADAKGYPTFADAPGASVVIARSIRGHDWLLRAEREGVLSLGPIDLEQVARIQPLQSERRRTVLWRILGRKLAGRPTPRYRGFQLLRATTLNPRKVVKALFGTIERTISPQSNRIPPS